MGKKIHSKIVIYTDGGARNNPGPAGIGIAIYDGGGALLETFKKYIGKATNNVAEYRALIIGLKRAKKYQPKEIECRLDSELVVRQIVGDYKTKDPKMKELLEEVRNLTFFQPVQFCHIPRSENKLADKLVNEAIDEAVY